MQVVLKPNFNIGTIYLKLPDFQKGNVLAYLTRLAQASSKGHSRIEAGIHLDVDHVGLNDVQAVGIDQLTNKVNSFLKKMPNLDR